MLSKNVCQSIFKKNIIVVKIHHSEKTCLGNIYKQRKNDTKHDSKIGNGSHRCTRSSIQPSAGIYRMATSSQQLWIVAPSYSDFKPYGLSSISLGEYTSGSYSYFSVLFGYYYLCIILCLYCPNENDIQLCWYHFISFWESVLYLLLLFLHLDYIY